MKELKVVAVPIGSLSDITPRAREALSGADEIICENLPRCRKLLCALDIRGKSLTVYAADNPGRAERVIKRCRTKDRCVLITGAGTPSVSDPGHLLVRAAREAGAAVTPVPGATAIAALISVCPRKIKDFVFTGFLPKSAHALKKSLEKYLALGIPVAAFTTKRDVAKLAAILGQTSPECAVFVGREMTKKFEEYVYFENAESFAGWAENLKGEITLILFPAPEKL